MSVAGAVKLIAFVMFLVISILVIHSFIGSILLSIAVVMCPQLFLIIYALRVRP